MQNLPVYVRSVVREARDTSELDTGSPSLPPHLYTYSMQHPGTVGIMTLWSLRVVETLLRYPEVNGFVYAFHGRRKGAAMNFFLGRVRVVHMHV